MRLERSTAAPLWPLLSYFNLRRGVALVDTGAQPTLPQTTAARRTFVGAAAERADAGASATPLAMAVFADRPLEKTIAASAAIRILFVVFTGISLKGPRMARR